MLTPKASGVCNTLNSEGSASLPRCRWAVPDQAQLPDDLGVREHQSLPSFRI